MKSIIRTTLLTVASFIPVVASAEIKQTLTQTFSYGWIPSGSTTGFCAATGIGCIASTVIYLINSVLVPVLFAVAFIVFLYGIAQAYIFSKGDAGKVEEGHKLLLWGIIGFVVMVSLWGLVNVVANSFGLSGSYAPRTPTSYR